MTNEKFTRPLMYRIVITFLERAKSRYPAAIYRPLGKKGGPRRITPGEKQSWRGIVLQRTLPRGSSERGRGNRRRRRWGARNTVERRQPRASGSVRETFPGEARLSAIAADNLRRSFRIFARERIIRPGTGDYSGSERAPPTEGSINYPVNFGGE